MPKDASANVDAFTVDPSSPVVMPVGSAGKVWGTQTKLHRWAAADPGRRFDDLFNLVHDPATLLVAFERVAGNRGARTPGIDGRQVADVQEDGVAEFLEDLRAQLRSGSFRPLPVRERSIPKPGGSGKVRRLGIPTVADRVVQAALKLVLEPIFEADFEPVSYGFRPKRRAQDAIAEIHLFASRGYQWVLDADIEACFDEIDHTALMGRVRTRIKDKRVLALVKAFLKAGVMRETGHLEDNFAGTPQGGILSPLLANIALSALDEHVHAPWKPGGDMSTGSRRRYRRQRGLANWRIVRYADDFAVLVAGQRGDVEIVREAISTVLATIGLRLSQAKTRVVHVDEGFDFLGFRIQRRRKRGSHKWFVYTFVGDRPIRSVKAKIRAMTYRTSQQDPAAALIRLGQILRGWSAYFQHAVAKNTFGRLAHFVWNRVVRWWQCLHHWNWSEFRRRFTFPDGRWKPLSAQGVDLFDLAAVTVSRYRYRGQAGIPSPWPLLEQAA